MSDKSNPKFVGNERRGRKERRKNVVDRRIDFDLGRGPGKRRGELRKAAEEGQMSDEQLEFLLAIDDYKRKNSRPFPTWTEVFDVIKALGYRKVAEPQDIKSVNDEKELAEVSK